MSELTREELMERWEMAKNKAKILKEKLLKKQRVIDRLDQVIKDKDQKIGSLMRALKRAREKQEQLMAINGCDDKKEETEDEQEDE